MFLRIFFGTALSASVRTLPRVGPFDTKVTLKAVDISGITDKARIKYSLLYSGQKPLVQIIFTGSDAGIPGENLLISTPRYRGIILGLCESSRVL